MLTTTAPYQCHATRPADPTPGYSAYPYGYLGLRPYVFSGVRERSPGALQGIATPWNVLSRSPPRGSKLRWLFRRGCFQSGLSLGTEVVLCVDHAENVRCGNLQLTGVIAEINRGLAFRAELPHSNIGRLVASYARHPGFSGVSTSTDIVESHTEVYRGEKVEVVTLAKLRHIALLTQGKKPAFWPTFAKLVS